MDHVLRRTSYTLQGIFGLLIEQASGNQVAVTLERAFKMANQIPQYVPKLASGLYICKRGMHQLAHMKVPFETFEVMDVPDFQGKPVSGILFHVGNWQDESLGCILMGEETCGSMLLSSKATFNRFMSKMKGIDSFCLTVK